MDKSSADLRYQQADEVLAERSSRYEVLAGRSNRSDVPVDRVEVPVGISSADLRYQ
jgi:hypothetical protein